MQAKLDVSAVMASYSTALRRLAAQTGRPQIDVLRGEAGIILKTCAGRTKIAPRPKTDKRSRRALGSKYMLTTASKVGDVTINLGIKPGKPIGRVWRRVGSNGGKGRFLLIGQMPEKMNSVRWLKLRKNGTWGKYSSAIVPVLHVIDNIERYIKTGRGAAGLSRQSWVQIADGLGLKLEQIASGGASPQVIAQARAALAANGKKYVNGSGDQVATDAKAQITLTNSLPWGVSAGLDRMLAAVVSGRTKYFERNYAKGTFDTTRNIARAYPWMRVTTSAV